MNHLQTIHIECQDLFSKKKNIFTSAAVVIGALRVKKLNGSTNVVFMTDYLEMSERPPGYTS